MNNTRVKKFVLALLSMLIIPFTTYSSANIFAQEPTGTVTVTQQEPDGSITTTTTTTVITVADLSTTDVISQAQRVLRDRGYYHGRINGVLDERTRDAIKDFQEDHHISKTHRLDLVTARMLGLNEWFAAHKTVAVVPAAPVDSDNVVVVPAAPETVIVTPVRVRTHVVSLASYDAISLTQQILFDRGYYKGKINGRLNDDTRDAIKKFQDDNDLKETGRIDAPTARLLGLEFDYAY